MCYSYSGIKPRTANKQTKKKETSGKETAEELFCFYDDKMTLGDTSHTFKMPEIRTK